MKMQRQFRVLRHINRHPYRFAGVVFLVIAFISLAYFKETPHEFQKYQLAIALNNTCARRFLPTSKNNEQPKEQEKYHRLLAAAKSIRGHSQTILVPILNDAYLPFGYNWLCNTKEMGIHKNVLFITTDDNSSEILKCDWPEVSAVGMNVNSLNGDQTFGQAGYLKVNIKRHQHIYRLLQEGYEILHFDLDQFWRKNPLPYLQSHKGYDLLVTKVTGYPSEYCSGFVYIFNTERTIKLWQLFVEKLEEAGREVESYRHSSAVPYKFMDQVPWSKIIHNKTIPDLSVKELSLDDFADGRWYDKTEEERRAINPFVIHNNHVVGNEAKLVRALEFNHWFFDVGLNCNREFIQKVKD